MTDLRPSEPWQAEIARALGADLTADPDACGHDWQVLIPASGARMCCCCGLWDPAAEAQRFA